MQKVTREGPRKSISIRIISVQYVNTSKVIDHLHHQGSMLSVQQCRFMQQGLYL